MLFADVCVAGHIFIYKTHGLFKVKKNKKINKNIEFDSCVHTLIWEPKSLQSLNPAI